MVQIPLYIQRSEYRIQDFLLTVYKPQARTSEYIRAGFNSDFAIPIPIPIPAFSDFTIPIPIPIPELTIPIPIPIPDLQFQFQFQFRSQGGTNIPRQYIYILLLLD